MSIINDIKKVTSPRHCRVTNSLGVYDAYKYIRKINGLIQVSLYQNMIFILLLER